MRIIFNQPWSWVGKLGSCKLRSRCGVDTHLGDSQMFNQKIYKIYRYLHSCHSVCFTSVILKTHTHKQTFFVPIDPSLKVESSHHLPMLACKNHGPLIHVILLVSLGSSKLSLASRGWDHDESNISQRTIRKSRWWIHNKLIRRVVKWKHCNLLYFLYAGPKH